MSNASGKCLAWRSEKADTSLASVKIHLGSTKSCTAASSAGEDDDGV